MDELDWKRLAAEVSAQHGIRVDSDDPMLAVVTLNRLAFEQVVERALTRLQASTEELERAAARVQVRAGSAIAQELKECTRTFEKDTQAAMDALLSAAKRLETKRSRSRTAYIAGFALALLILLAGAWLGAQITRRSSGG